MIRQDLIAERIVINVYRDPIRFFGEKDPTTRVIFEEILKDEKERANDLTDLLFITNPSTGRPRETVPELSPIVELRKNGGVQSWVGIAPGSWQVSTMRLALSF